MTTDLPLVPESRPERWFRRVADGDLTAEEFRTFEDRIAADPGFRGDYVRFMDMEANLYEELSGKLPVASRAPDEIGGLPRSSAHWMRWITVAAAAIVLGCSFWMWSAQDSTQNVTRYLEAQLRGLEDAAVVTHVKGIRQAAGDMPLQVGVRLKPGVLDLRQGELQVDFFSGARVMLRAPAELHVLSSESATLVSGSAAARVTEGVGKFILGAPDAAIVDLGTEFGVNVGPSGDSQVHVFDGEVELSLLGDDGSTLFSQRLGAKETVAIDRSSRTVRPIEASDGMFASVRDLDHTRLRVTPAYVDAVRKSRPLLYWRFDDAEGDQIPNAAGGGPGGQVVTKGAHEGIEFSNGAVRFSASDKPRYLISRQPLGAINSKSFSIELWLQSDTIHWGTIANLIVPSTDGPEAHLALLELAHHTQMVHKPCVVRFLHRHPPGGHTWGWNLFGNDTCTPGQWTHVVAVKEPDELRLYVNGVLVRSIHGSETAGGDDRPYQLTLGQITTSTTGRQFQGVLDELAIYDRALTPSEVIHHYWTMISGDSQVAPDAGPRPGIVATSTGLLY